MKKSIIYFLIFIFICFILPVILTKTNYDNEEKLESDNSTENSGNNEIGSIIDLNDSEIEEQLEIYDGDYSTIQLLNHETGIVEEVNLEEYLYNVVAAEMPANFELEALKAQAVVARTYTIYKVENKKHDNADICTNFACCQAYITKEERFAAWEESERESNWEKIVTAVNETVGQIITYEDKPINAFFHSNSGGITEIPVNVWGGTGYPYLQVVETAGEEAYSQYDSEVILSQDELIEKLKVQYADIEIDFAYDDQIQILQYTDSDRVKTVRFGNYEIAGTEVRTLLGLRSTNFVITKKDNNIIFSVIGYGHGVGMSQTGADAMAKTGSDFKDIIHHFYKDVQIKQLNK